MTEAKEWQGRVGGVWAEEWRLTDMSFAGLAAPLDVAIAAAAPDHGCALDIGCGAGVTSLALATARPGLEVLGVDLSEPLVAVARTRANGVANVTFRAANVTETVDMIGGGGSFDLAFSRHGVMFFPDPVEAFRVIRRMLKPGAPLIFSCFAAPVRNPWVGSITAAAGITPAPAGGGYVPGPFAFADPEFVGNILKQSGFIPDEPRLTDYTYRAGEGPDAAEMAFHFFQRIGPAARLLAAAAPAERPAIQARLRAFLTEQARDGVVEFPASAWIWTAHASTENVQ